MLTGPLTRWVGLCVALLSAPAPACEVDATVPGRREDGAWVQVVRTRSLLPALTVLSLRETGQDVALDVSHGQVRSDLLPSRHAIEQAAWWTWGRSTHTVEIVGDGVDVASPPETEATCVPGRQPLFVGPWLLSRAATFAARAGANEPAAAREANRAASLRALDALESVAGATSWIDAATLASAAHLRAHLAQREGRYADAAGGFAVARRRWEAAAEPALAAAAQFNEAQALLQSGQGKRAEASLASLLEPAARERAPIVHFWARNDECWTRRVAGDLEGAVQCFERLVPVLRQARERREAANSLCNLGATYGALRRWEDAHRAVLDCEGQRRLIGLPYGIAHALLLRGWIETSLGRPAQALSTFEEGSAFAERGGDAAQAWDFQRWTAQAWVDLDMADRAMDVYRRHPPDEAQDPGRFGAWHLAQGQVASLVEDIPAARAHLRQASSVSGKAGNAAGATSADCLLAVIDADAALAEGCAPVLSAQAHAKRGQWTQARTLALQAQGAEDHRALAGLLAQIAAAHAEGKADLAALRRAVDEAAQQLAGREAARGRFLMRAAFELVELQQRLGGDGLLELARDARLSSGTESAAVGLTQERLPAPRAILPGDGLPARSQLADDTQLLVSVSSLGTTYLLAFSPGHRTVVTRLAHDDLRGIAEADGDSARIDGANDARRLADAVKLQDWLLPATRRLALVLHGPLSRMPWAAMATEGPVVPRLGYRPLVDQVSIVHWVPSEAVAEATAEGRIVILKGEGSGLPGVEWETRQLAERAAGQGWSIARQLTDAQGFGRLRILHVGGHGWANRLVPADSTLHLAAPGGWQQVPVPVALAPRSDLVVLAACETAAGAGSDWRMDQSMAARMTSAGSRRVLAHLWPVGDMPSARLHDAFYRALFDGAAAEDALAAAQRASIASLRDHHARDWASAVMFAALPRGAGAAGARRD